MQKNREETMRLVMNAALIGVYIVLSYLAIPLGGLKITFEHFPVILSAIAFGPADAMLVGGLGELINQMVTYGFTLTTVLWILPILFRGAFLGILSKLWSNRMGADAICKSRFPLAFIIICIVSGLFASCLNTFAFYVDSKMLGYYQYALVFGTFLMRVLMSAISSFLMGLMTKAVLYALRKQGLI